MTTISATVTMPVSLRGKLEAVRLLRAERTSRVPRLKELIIEAITRFVEDESRRARPSMAVR